MEFYQSKEGYLFCEFEEIDRDKFLDLKSDFKKSGYDVCGFQKGDKRRSTLDVVREIDDNVDSDDFWETGINVDLNIKESEDSFRKIIKFVKEERANSLKLELTVIKANTALIDTWARLKKLLTDDGFKLKTIAKSSIHETVEVRWRDLYEISHLQQ